MQSSTYGVASASVAYSCRRPSSEQQRSACVASDLRERPRLSSLGTASTDHEMIRTWQQILVIGSIVLGAQALVRAEGAPWIGSYDNTLSPAESQQVVDAAIEHGTRDMSMLQRKIARSRLKAVNPPNSQLRILAQGDQLITEFDGRRYRAPLDGSPARGVDPRGRRVTVSYHVVGNVLQARYLGEDGEKRMDFEPSSNGKGLTMRVTLVSKTLPEPVRYSMQYERE